MSIHKPVLLNEVIEYLNLGDPSTSSGQAGTGKKVIDATLDGGGHTNAILDRYPEIQVLGIELDPVQVREMQPRERLTVVNDSYVCIKDIAERHDFYPDGIIFDLGLSSWHYEASERGFSFKRNEMLDMRFNPETMKTSAAEIVNTWDEREIERILREFGEEQFSKEIARNIVENRKEKAIINTDDLVSTIEKTVPGWYKHRKIHFATKTFQALRVAVNDELGSVKQGMEAAIEVLKPGGRLVVISFQGLEDKIVRETFKEKAKEGVIKWVTRDTIKPSWNEITENPRARSAKMKIVEKL